MRQIFFKASNIYLSKGKFIQNNKTNAVFLLANPGIHNSNPNRANKIMNVCKLSSISESFPIVYWKMRNIAAMSSCHSIPSLKSDTNTTDDTFANDHEY